MSFGRADVNERSYAIMEGKAPRATRLGLFSTTLRIEMMKRLHFLLSGDDYEQLRMTNRARAAASRVAVKIYKYGFTMQIYVAEVRPQIVKTRDEKPIRLAGHPDLIDTFLQITDHAVELRMKSKTGSIMPF